MGNHTAGAVNRARDLWLVIAGAAIGGTLAEFALILAARIVLQRYTLLNPQGIWLAPIANVAIIAPAVFAVWGLVRVMRREWAFPAAVTVAVGLAALEPLLVLKERLHIAALLVLALGIGVATGRLVAARPAFAARWSRRLTAVLAAVALLGALAFNVTRGRRERRAVAGLGVAAEGAPNVLLLVLDTVRALSLSAYGYARPTSPVLAQVARRGVRFDRAVATSPWTLPTHASLFTGRYAHELTAGWSVPLDDTYPTLAERLTSLGYATAGFAANLRYCSYEFGLDRGFGYYRDYDVSFGEAWRSSSLALAVAMFFIERFNGYNAPGRLFAERMNERFLGWIDRAYLPRRRRPFFAFINYYDAHGPYAPPAPFDTMFSGREPPTRDSGSRDFTPTEVAGLLDAYDGSIAYLDRQLGALFAALERRGLLENTLVIVTSDHGEEFNEHGQMNHGNTLYFPSLHVPLIVAGPGVPRGTAVAEPVTLRDVPATVLELIGGAGAHSLPGTSLARHWRSDSLGTSDPLARSRAPDSPVYAEVDYARNLPAYIPVSQGPMKSVVVDGYHYISGSSGAEELFDVRRDPWERNNLITADSLAQTLARARDLLAAARARDVRRAQPSVATNR
ncbi:MAG: sulfatase [Gemmatimonadaceae bacterium]